MSQKVNKAKKQTGTKWKTVRVREEMKTRAHLKLKEINNKDRGRKLKLDEVLSFALERLTDSDIQVLRERSLSNADRKESLRQKYIETYGAITIDEFEGFTMTAAYFEFLKEHGRSFSAA